MNKKVRYLLLLFGFIIFLIISPLIILYVSGITFDPQSKTFVRTGILAVRSQPTSAEIFLNNKLVRKNQGDIKFLTAGEYQVEIKKDGFKPWNKRLSVYKGQVTWANPAFNYIYLFFNEPKIQKLQSGVLDFYKNGDKLTTLTQEGITVASVNDPSHGQTYPLTSKFSKILAADQSGNNLILTDSGSELGIFNVNTGKLYSLSGLFDSLPKLQFDANGNLYALYKDTLYVVDFHNQTKAMVLKNIAAFYWQENNLYYAKQAERGYSLQFSQPPFRQNQSLLADFSADPNLEMYVTFDKQILLVTGGSLYTVGEKGLTQLADSVQNVNFDASGNIFSIIHLGQLDYFGSGNLNFVTRKSGIISNAVINTQIAEAFFNDKNRLSAIELDSRDNQNTYILYEGKDLKKFFVDDVGKNILVLDDGELKSLVVR